MAVPKEDWIIVRNTHEPIIDEETFELVQKFISVKKRTYVRNSNIRKYESVTELNRSMLVELIDSIYVYQAEETGRERKQKVEINYRFLAGSQCGIA